MKLAAFPALLAVGLLANYAFAPDDGTGITYHVESTLPGHMCAARYGDDVGFERTWNAFRVESTANNVPVRCAVPPTWGSVGNIIDIRVHMINTSTSTYCIGRRHEDDEELDYVREDASFAGDQVLVLEDVGKATRWAEGYNTLYCRLYGGDQLLTYSVYSYFD